MIFRSFPAASILVIQRHETTPTTISGSAFDKRRGYTAGQAALTGYPKLDGELDHLDQGRTMRGQETETCLTCGPWYRSIVLDPSTVGDAATVSYGDCQLRAICKPILEPRPRHRKDV